MEKMTKLVQELEAELKNKESVLELLKNKAKGQEKYWIWSEPE